MIMQGRGLLCKYPSFQNKKAIMFYNTNSWLISSTRVSSQCTKCLHMEPLVWVPYSPMGRQHRPILQKRKLRLGGSLPGRQSHGPEWRPGSRIWSVFLAVPFGAKERREATGRGFGAVFGHMCHTALAQARWLVGGPRDLELRIAVQTPPGWPTEDTPRLPLAPALLRVAAGVTWGQTPGWPWLHNNVSVLRTAELTSALYFCLFIYLAAPGS